MQDAHITAQTLRETATVLLDEFILPHAERHAGDSEETALMLFDPDVIGATQQEENLLRRTFTHYASKCDRECVSAVSRAARGEGGKGVKFQQCLEFALEFKVTPSLITKTELFQCYRSTLLHAQGRC
jgi:hypothetical protein